MKDKGLIPKPWRSTSPRPTDYAGAPPTKGLPKKGKRQNIQDASQEAGGISPGEWWNPGGLK